MVEKPRHCRSLQFRWESKFVEIPDISEIEKVL